MYLLNVVKISEVLFGFTGVFAKGVNIIRKRPACAVLLIRPSFSALRDAAAPDMHGDSTRWRYTRKRWPLLVRRCCSSDPPCRGCRAIRVRLCIPLAEGITPLLSACCCSLPCCCSALMEVTQRQHHLLPLPELSIAPLASSDHLLEDTSGLPVAAY